MSASEYGSENDLAPLARQVLEELERYEGIAFASGGGSGGGQGKGNPLLRKVWEYLREQIYLMMCTDSAEYQRERELLRQSQKQAIIGLSGLLVRTFGLEADSAGALAELALKVPMKIGKNSWCACYVKESIKADGPYAYFSDEREELARIANYPELLSSSDPVERDLALRRVYHYEEEGTRAVPALTSLLSDPNASVRGDAAFALSQLKEGAVGAGPTLMQLLSDPDVWVRRHAANALGWMAVHKAHSVPLLQLVAKNDSDSRTRGNAAQPLARLSPDGN